MKLKLALALTIVAIGIHAYLTLHYYDLNYGMGAAESICNISAKLNCDAVAASSYSTFLKTPIALWGGITNLVLLTLLFGWMLGWTNDVPRLGRYTYWFSGGVAIASLVMGSISLFAMSVFCVFCIAAYLISFSTFLLLRSAQEDDTRPTSEYIRELFTSARSYLIFILIIPLLSLFFNFSMTSKEGPKALQRLAKQSLEQWRVNPVINFSAPALVKGATDATATVVLAEFADFRCGHCKAATATIDAFLSSRPDVQMRFYFFPLDKACNDSVTSEDGISCVEAKAVACAEQTAKKGWPMHDLLFAQQEEFHSSGMTLDSAKTKVTALATGLEVDSETFKTCLESAELHERIKKMAKEGADAGIKGTPSFFIQGKKLEVGQVLSVLEAAYNAAKDEAPTK